SPDNALFFVDVAGNTINFNIRQKLMRVPDMNAICTFPETNKQLKLGELCATQDASPKEGYHDQPGVLIVRGPGIKKGAELEECSSLDLAPTILHLMGLEIPSYMKGRVLTEMFEEADSASEIPDGQNQFAPSAS